MKMFKGFNEDLTCKGYQYEIGKEYETDTAKLCEAGFHACEYPLDVLGYYPPTSRFCEVDLDGVTDESDNDTKRVGTKIAIKAEIGLPGLINAAVEFIKEKVNWENASD